MTTLVLASTSPYRKVLLERLRLPFEVASPDVDETPRPSEAPMALAARLAQAKAQAVAQRYAGRDALIIASDQVAELDGQPLGKPGNAEACFEMLRRARGRTLRFHTALCVLQVHTGQVRASVEPFEVRMRALDDARLQRYVTLERPFDAAGGFYSEGLGIVLFEAMQGRDPNALVGLPLIALADMLSHFGVDPLAPAQGSEA